MFRQEVAEDRKNRLLGDVFVAQPVQLSTLTALIVALVALAVILLVAGSYARSERVSGYLSPSNGLVKIRAGNYGVVSELMVAEGDVVQAGQRLASIRLMQETGEIDSPTAQSANALKSQQDQLDTQISLESGQYATDAAKLRSEQLELKAAIRSLISQLELQRKIVLSSERTYLKTREIADKGYAPRIEVERRYQEWLGVQAEQSKMDQELTRTRSLLGQNELRLGQLPLTSQQKVSRLRQERQVVSERVGDLLSRRVIEIVSPVAGRIVAITGAREGGSLEPSQSFISILPKDSVIRAEIFVPSRAAGFLEIGQDVKLLYDAFPYQRFGSHRAVISSIGETILTPEEVGAPFKVSEPVYRIVADLDNATILVRSQRIRLQSGMTLKANIILERRSFMDWLLGPLRAVRARS